LLPVLADPTLEPSGPSARLLPEGFGGAASPFRVSSAGMNVTSGIFAWIESCIRGKCGSAAGACVIMKTEMSNRKTFTRLTLPRACLRFGCWSSLCPVSLLTSKPKSDHEDAKKFQKPEKFDLT
jgi:hypothetical protein